MFNLCYIYESNAIFSQSHLQVKNNISVYTQHMQHMYIRNICFFFGAIKNIILKVYPKNCWKLF